MTTKSLELAEVVKGLSRLRSVGTLWKKSIRRRVSGTLSCLYYVCGRAWWFLDPRLGLPSLSTKGKNIGAKFITCIIKIAGNSIDVARCNTLVLRNAPVTPTPSIFPKVLPYKWGAYCRTNGRRTAVQMGGVLQGFLRSLEARTAWRYKWGAYCRTNWRYIAVPFRQVVGVGVSETLPNYIMKIARNFFDATVLAFQVQSCEGVMQSIAALRSD